MYINFPTGSGPSGVTITVDAVSGKTHRVTTLWGRSDADSDVDILAGDGETVLAGGALTVSARGKGFFFHEPRGLAEGTVGGAIKLKVSAGNARVNATVITYSPDEKQQLDCG